MYRFNLPKLMLGYILFKDLLEKETPSFKFLSIYFMYN